MMKPWENISYFGNQKIISQLNTLYENDKPVSYTHLRAHET